MAQQISKAKFIEEKDILLASPQPFTIPVVVSNTGVNAVNGRKILKAGSPVGAETSVLETRNTKLVLTTTLTATQAQGVLRHDIDVTNGDANAELIVFGIVDSSKCPEIAEEIKKALTHIIFVNGGSY